MADPAVKPSVRGANGLCMLSEDACWALVALWLSPVLFAWIRLSGRPDELAGMLAVTVGAAWTMWRAAPGLPQRPAAWQLTLCGVFWTVMLWRLASSWPEDFWWVEHMLPVAAAAFAFLWWGRSGAGQAWRAPVALLLWVGLPSFVWLNRLDAGGTVSRATAAAAEFMLWHLGAEPVRHGATLQLPRGAVEVLTGCTGLPLAGGLWRLLLPLVLALRIRWWRTLLLAALVVPLSFGVAVGRVMLMAEVVSDSARLRYWHDAPGSSWFTALAIVILAAGVALAMRRSGASVAATSVPVSRGLVGLTAAIACLGLVLVWCHTPREDRLPPSALVAGLGGPADPIAQKVPDGWRTIAGCDADHPLLWVRGYDEVVAGMPVRVWIGYAPRWLDGDPVELNRRYAAASQPPDAGSWAIRPLTAGGTVREQVTEGRCVWLVALGPDGRAGGTMAEWGGVATAWPRTAARWMGWLAGRAPLRDKRGFWLRLEMAGNSAASTKAMEQVLRAWQNHIPEILVPPPR